MEDISRLDDSVFRGADPLANLYLRGGVPNGYADHNISYSEGKSVVPFAVNAFAIRNIELGDDLKKSLDEWVEKEGPQKIDRFLYWRNLTGDIKKGDDVALFVEFPDDDDWIKQGSFYIPNENIKRYLLL